MKRDYHRDPIDSFLHKITLFDGGYDTLCWKWTASNYGGRHPYGLMIINGRRVKAHRFSYELYIGPIPDGFEAHHKCTNVWCVNPNHLEAISKSGHRLQLDSCGGKNKAKTNCKHGHKFTEENTYRFGPGKSYRDCEACRVRRRAEYQIRKLLGLHLLKGAEVILEPAAISTGGSVSTATSAIRSATPTTATTTRSAKTSAATERAV